MHKTSYVVSAFLALAVFISPAVLAQQEEKITITTYYPSPTGVYNQLQAKRVIIGDVNGDGSINSADVPVNARPLYVQDNSTSGYTAAFVNRDGYGLALGASYTATYAAIQSNTFVNGGGAASPSVTNLSINPDGGNVSIGTSISSAKLRVDTSAINDGIALVNDPYWLKIVSGTVGDGSYNPIVRANDTALIYSNGTQGTGSFVIAPWATGVSGLKMDGNGRVGINTVNPGFALDVADRMRVRQGVNTAGIWFYQTTPAADRAFVGMRNDDYVGFWGHTGAGWGMVMNTTNGNVGIGTTTPTEKLIVNGTVKMGTNGSLFGASGDEKIRIVRGSVQSDGSILRGSGFTVSHSATGKYNINFITAFSAAPSVTATWRTTASTTDRDVYVESVAASGVVIDGLTGSGASFADVNFDFIAVGPP